MYAILFFMVKYLLVFVQAIGRCGKSFKIASILKALYFVYDNATVTVPSDFFGMVDITPFLNLVVYLLSHHSHGGAMQIVISSVVKNWYIN